MHARTQTGVPLRSLRQQVGVVRNAAVHWKLWPWICRRLVIHIGLGPQRGLGFGCRQVAADGSQVEQTLESEVKPSATAETLAFYVCRFMRKLGTFPRRIFLSQTSTHGPPIFQKARHWWRNAITSSPFPSSTSSLARRIVGPNDPSCEEPGFFAEVWSSWIANSTSPRRNARRPRTVWPANRTFPTFQFSSNSGAN